MSFGSHITNDHRGFSPILRLLDEFDQYSRSNDRTPLRKSNSFVPKFDIKENKDVYDLYGEFPGIDQKDIHIEFSDASTLTIKGHVERRLTKTSNETKASPRSVTVEDEDSSNKTQSIQVKVDKKSEQSEENYWITERSFGEFYRTFAFPVPVDQDCVKASMKNGILNVTVPKAKKHPGRKILIE